MVQSRIVFFKAKQLFLSTKFTTGWTLFLLGSEQTKIMDLPPQKLPLRSFYIFHLSTHLSRFRRLVPSSFFQRRAWLPGRRRSPELPASSSSGVPAARSGRHRRVAPLFLANQHLAGPAAFTPRSGRHLHMSQARIRCMSLVPVRLRYLLIESMAAGSGDLADINRIVLGAFVARMR
jgi:hypothetical protein